jgi:hypothetical protein
MRTCTKEPLLVAKMSNTPLSQPASKKEPCA